MIHQSMIDRRSFMGGTAALFASAGLPWPAFAATASQLSAFQIYDGMGTRAKPNDPAYRNFRWQPLISEDLGLRHTRGSIGHNRADVQYMKPLFDRGVKHCATITQSAKGLSWTEAKANIDGIVNIWGPANVPYIEGANEYNRNKYAGWVTDLRNFTKQTHDYVRSIPALANNKLVPPSVYRRIHEDYLAIGDLSPWTDTGCGHYYSGAKKPTLSAYPIDACLADMRILNPAPPLITEMGVDLGLVPGPKVQAKYLLRMHIELLRRGAQRCYIFETFDTMSGHRYGLMDANLNKRPAYYAMKNLVALVKDVPSAPKPLEYQYSGPTDVQRLVVSKSDGTFLLFMWRDLNSVEADAAPVNVTVSFGSAYSRLEVFEPTYSAEVKKSAASVSSIQVPVADHVVVMRVTP